MILLEQSRKASHNELAFLEEVLPQETPPLEATLLQTRADAGLKVKTWA